MTVTSVLNSPASTVGVIAFFFLLMAWGKVLPITWVDKLLKSKDETIETLTKELADLNKAAPIVVKIMEELNRQAVQKKTERTDSGDYDA